MYCNICNKNVRCKDIHDRHVTSRIHLAKVNKLNKLAEKLEKKKVLKANTEFIFDLKNREGKIVNKTLVDEAVYHHIVDNGYSLYYSNYYVNITIHNYAELNLKRNMLLHRYIYYIYYKNADPVYRNIDHINTKPMDNRIENLREASDEINSGNRVKLKNASSKFYGVSKHRNKWQCKLRISKSEIYTFLYENELHAAYHYDLLVKQFTLDKKLNNIEKPEGFILKEKKIPRNLPLGVFRSGKKYGYQIRNKKTIGFQSVEDAFIARNEHIRKSDEEKENFRLSQPIKRNIDGEAMIEIFNKKREKINEVIIDDDNYYHLTQYAWSICKSKNGAIHVSGEIKGKHATLSRYIKNVTDKNKMVDHVDGNVLNNKESNLRIVTAWGNSQNKCKTKNKTTSSAVGVHFNSRGKWVATIRLDYKMVLNKCFNTEEEAIMARNMKVMELNKTKGTLFKIQSIK